MSRQVAKVLAAQIVNRVGCKAPPDPAIARVASRRVLKLKRLSVRASRVMHDLLVRAPWIVRIN